MSYLARIDRKLNELVKSKNAEEAEKEPTQEEKDEERLREIEERMTDLIDLLSEGVTRESADARVGEHRERVKSGKGEPRPLLKVFHDHGGKRIATTRRTQVSPSSAANFFVFIEITAVFCVWLCMQDTRMNLIFIFFFMPHLCLVAVSWLAMHLLAFFWACALRRLYGAAAEQDDAGRLAQTKDPRGQAREGPGARPAHPGQGAGGDPGEAAGARGPKRRGAGRLSYKRGRDAPKMRPLPEEA
jgi:hypothetical protein